MMTNNYVSFQLVVIKADIQCDEHLRSVNVYHSAIRAWYKIDTILIGTICVDVSKEVVGSRTSARKGKSKADRNNKNLNLPSLKLYTMASVPKDISRSRRSKPSTHFHPQSPPTVNKAIHSFGPNTSNCKQQRGIW
jgi:hypothetical protein